LHDGTVLCDVFNHCWPDSLKKIYRGKIAFRQLENISMFLKAARDIGVPSRHLFDSVDLFEYKNPRAVVDTVLNLFLIAKEDGVLSEEENVSVSSHYSGTSSAALRGKTAPLPELRSNPNGTVSILNMGSFRMDGVIDTSNVNMWESNRGEFGRQRDSARFQLHRNISRPYPFPMNRDEEEALPHSTWTRARKKMSSLAVAAKKRLSMSSTRDSSSTRGERPEAPPVLFALPYISENHTEEDNEDHESEGESSDESVRDQEVDFALDVAEEDDQQKISDAESSVADDLEFEAEEDLEDGNTSASDAEDEKDDDDEEKSEAADSDDDAVSIASSKSGMLAADSDTEEDRVEEREAVVSLHDSDASGDESDDEKSKQDSDDEEDEEKARAASVDLNDDELDDIVNEDDKDSVPDEELAQALAEVDDLLEFQGDRDAEWLEALETATARLDLLMGERRAAKENPASNEEHEEDEAGDEDDHRDSIAEQTEDDILQEEIGVAVKHASLSSRRASVMTTRSSIAGDQRLSIASRSTRASAVPSERISASSRRSAASAAASERMSTSSRRSAASASASERMSASSRRSSQRLSKSSARSSIRNSVTNINGNEDAQSQMGDEHTYLAEELESPRDHTSSAEELPDLSSFAAADISRRSQDRSSVRSKLLCMYQADSRAERKKVHEKEMEEVEEARAAEEEARQSLLEEKIRRRASTDASRVRSRRSLTKFLSGMYRGSQDSTTERD